MKLLRFNDSKKCSPRRHLRGHQQIFRSSSKFRRSKGIDWWLYARKAWSGCRSRTSIYGAALRVSSPRVDHLGLTLSLHHRDGGISASDSRRKSNDTARERTDLDPKRYADLIVVTVSLGVSNSSCSLHSVLKGFFDPLRTDDTRTDFFTIHRKKADEFDRESTTRT